MSDRRNIIPNVCQIDAQRVHGFSMSAVIFDFAAAMATGFDGGSELPKCFGLSFGIVKEAVMAGIQAVFDRQAKFDIDRDPMSERQPPFHQVASQ